MLFRMVCCCPQNGNLPNGKLGQAWLFLLSGSEEIAIIVALEIRVRLSIRGKSETFVVFTKKNLFLEV